MAYNFAAEVSLRLNAASLQAVQSQLRNSLKNATNLSAGDLGALRGYADTLARARSQTQSLEQATRGLSSAVGSAKGNAAALTRELRGAGETAARTAKAFQDINSGTKGASSSMEAFAHQAGLAARRYAAFALASGTMLKVANEIKTAVTEAINFDREFVRLLQVSEDSRHKVRDLTGEIGRLSREFGVSSSELIRTAVLFKQAGLTIDQTKSSMEALAKAALAPNFDSLAQTAEGAIAVMKQFKIGAADLEGALGSINSVAGAFAVEAGDLIEVVRRVGGVFSGLSASTKAPRDSLNELLALFTSVRATTREDASIIANGLKTIFTRLQRPETVEALKELGVQLRFTRAELEETGRSLDLQEQFVGAFEAVRRLSQALNDIPSTDPKFARIVEQLGGVWQLGRVIPLVQQFGEAQKALAVAQAGQTSLAVNAAQAQEALSVRLQKSKENWLDLGRVVADSSGFRNGLTGILGLADGLSTLLKYVTPLIPALTALAAISGFRAISGAVGAFAFDRSSGTRATTVQRRASGGRIEKVPGVGFGDKVPVMAEPGELIVPRHQAQKFATGGLVPRLFGNTHNRILRSLNESQKTPYHKPQYEDDVFFGDVGFETRGQGLNVHPFDIAVRRHAEFLKSRRDPLRAIPELAARQASLAAGQADDVRDRFFKLRGYTPDFVPTLGAASAFFGVGDLRKLGGSRSVSLRTHPYAEGALSNRVLASLLESAVNLSDGTTRDNARASVHAFLTPAMVKRLIASLARRNLLGKSGLESARGFLHNSTIDENARFASGGAVPRRANDALVQAIALATGRKISANQAPTTILPAGFGETAPTAVTSVTPFGASPVPRRADDTLIQAIEIATRKRFAFGGTAVANPKIRNDLLPRLGGVLGRRGIPGINFGGLFENFIVGDRRLPSSGFLSHGFNDPLSSSLYVNPTSILDRSSGTSLPGVLLHEAFHAANAKAGVAAAGLRQIPLHGTFYGHAGAVPAFQKAAEVAEGPEFLSRILNDRTLKVYLEKTKNVSDPKAFLTDESLAQAVGLYPSVLAGKSKLSPEIQRLVREISGHAVPGIAAVSQAGPPLVGQPKILEERLRQIRRGKFADGGPATLAGIPVFGGAGLSLPPEIQKALLRTFGQHPGIANYVRGIQLTKDAPHSFSTPGGDRFEDLLSGKGGPDGRTQTLLRILGRSTPADLSSRRVQGDVDRSLFQTGLAGIYRSPNALQSLVGRDPTLITGGDSLEKLARFSRTNFFGFGDQLREGNRSTVAAVARASAGGLTPEEQGILTSFVRGGDRTAGLAAADAIQERGLEKPAAVLRRLISAGARFGRFASGGLVPGVGNTDSVPLNLPVGSFVINKQSTRKLGADRLASYAAGGNSGGGVPGRGFVPALVMPGEHIFSPEQAARIGRPVLEKLNKFGLGGPVRLAAGGTPGSASPPLPNALAITGVELRTIQQQLVASLAKYIQATDINTTATKAEAEARKRVAQAIAQADEAERRAAKSTATAAKAAAQRADVNTLTVASAQADIRARNTGQAAFRAGALAAQTGNPADIAQAQTLAVDAQRASQASLDARESVDSATRRAARLEAVAAKQAASSQSLAGGNVVAVGSDFRGNKTFELASAQAAVAGNAAVVQTGKDTLKGIAEQRAEERLAKFKGNVSGDTRQLVFEQESKRVQDQYVRAVANQIRSLDRGTSATEAKRIAEERLAQALQNNSARVTTNAAGVVTGDRGIDAPQLGFFGRAVSGIRNSFRDGDGQNSFNSIGAFAALTALPVLTELIRPTNPVVAAEGGAARQGFFAAGGGLAGAASLGLTGAVVGSQLGIGAKIPALGGALVGLATGIRDAQAQITEAKLGLAVQKVADELGFLSQGLKDFGPGSARILEEQQKEISTQSLDKARQESSYLLGLVRSQSGTKTVFDRLEKVEFNKQLPGLVNVINKEIDRRATSPAGKGESPQQILDFVLGSNGGALGRQSSRIARGLGLTEAEHLERLRTQAAGAVQNVRADQANKLATTAAAQAATQLEHLAQAARASVLAMESFGEQGRILTSLFDGTPSNVTFDPIGRRLAEPGASGTGFADAISSLGGFLSGGRRANLNEEASAVALATRELPGILAAANARRGDKDKNFNFSNEVTRALTDAAGASAGTAGFRRVSDLIGGQLTNTDVEKTLATGGGDLSKITSQLIRAITSPLEEGLKDLKDAVTRASNEYIGGLRGVYANEIRIREDQGRLAEANLNLLRNETGNALESRGIRRDRAADFLTPDQLNAPFRQGQANLAGADGLNPQALSARLAALRPQLLAGRDRVDAAILGRSRPGGEAEFRAATESFTSLESESQKLVAALKNLTNASTAAAGTVEKLNRLQQEEEGRLAAGERLALEGPGDRSRRRRGERLALEVAQGGGRRFRGRQAEQFFDATRLFDQVPQFNGQTGSEVRRSFLQRFIPGAALSPEKAGEKASLQNELTNAFKTASAAQEQLLQNQFAVQVEIKDLLTRQQDAFLKGFAAPRLIDERGEASRERGSAAASLRTGKSLFDSLPAISTAFGGSSTDLEKVAKFALPEVGAALRDFLSSDKDLPATRERVGKLDALKFEDGRLKLGDEVLHDIRNAPEGRLNPLDNSNAPGLADELVRRGLLIRSEADDATRAFQATRFATGSDFVRHAKGATVGTVAELENRLSASSTTLGNAGLLEGSRRFDRSIPPQRLIDAAVSLRQFSGKSADEIGAEAKRLGDEFKTLGATVGALDDAIRAIQSPRVTDALPQAGKSFLDLGLGAVGLPKVARFAGGGLARGTDTVPAMLTPDEFVVNAASSVANRGLLHKINEARGPVYLADGGVPFRHPFFPPLAAAPRGNRGIILPPWVPRGPLDGIDLGPGFGADPSMGGGLPSGPGLGLPAEGAFPNNTGFGTFDFRETATPSFIREARRSSRLTSLFRTGLGDSAILGLGRPGLSAQRALEASLLRSDQSAGFRQGLDRGDSRRLLDYFASRSSGRVLRRNSGGPVFGPAGIDRVPAALTSGEFVLNTRAVARAGMANLQRFNDGGIVRNAFGVEMPQFAQGGVVAASGGGSNSLSGGSDFGKAVDRFIRPMADFGRATEDFGKHVSTFDEAVQKLEKIVDKFQGTVRVEGQQTVQVTGSVSVVGGGDSSKAAVEASVNEQVEKNLRRRMPDYF